jgi:hypothetical protein
MGVVKVIINKEKILRIGKGNGKIIVEFKFDNSIIRDLIYFVDGEVEVDENLKEDVANAILNNFNLKNYREKLKDFIQRNNIQIDFNKISKIDYESYDEIDKSIEFYQIIDELGIKTPEKLNNFIIMSNDAVRRELEENKYFADKKSKIVVKMFYLYGIVKEEDLKNEILKIAKDILGDIISQMDVRDIHRWRKRTYYNDLSDVLRAIDSISKMGYYDLIKEEVEELRLKMLPYVDESFKKLIAKRVSSEEKDEDIKREAQVLIKILREKSLLSYLV